MMCVHCLHCGGRAETERKEAPYQPVWQLQQFLVTFYMSDISLCVALLRWQLKAPSLLVLQGVGPWSTSRL